MIYWGGAFWRIEDLRLWVHGTFLFIWKALVAYREAFDFRAGSDYRL